MTQPYDLIMADIEAAKMSQRAACTAAGVASNTLAMAKETKRLKLDTIGAFAGLFKKPMSYYLGEAPAAVSTVPQAAAWQDMTPSPLNPRKHFEEETLRGLAESIAKEGVHIPLLVRKAAHVETDLEIIAGERRWRAVGILTANGRAPNDYQLPIKLIDPCDDRRALELAITENVARQDMTPWEEAQAFAALRHAGATVEDIAKTVGLVNRTIQKRLRLVTHLDPAVQEALRAGTISVEIANTFASHCPKDKQAEELTSRAHYIADASAEALRDNFDWKFKPKPEPAPVDRSPAPAPKPKKPTKAEIEAQQLNERRQEFASWLTAALAEKVCNDPPMAFRLWAISCSASEQRAPLPYGTIYSQVAARLIVELPETVAAQFDPPREIDLDDGERAAGAIGGFRSLREDGDMLSLWRELGKPGRGDWLDRALAHAIAAAIEVEFDEWGVGSPVFLGVHPILVDVAKHYGIEIPAEMMPPQADLEEAIAATGKCRECGCTDAQACQGGCHWVEPDLCSQCAGKTKAGKKRGAK